MKKLAFRLLEWGTSGMKKYLSSPNDSLNMNSHTKISFMLCLVNIGNKALSNINNGLTEMFSICIGDANKILSAEWA